MRTTVPGWALAALLLSHAPAAELSGVTMADEVMVPAGPTLLLNGMGVRKKLWIKIYIGGLYLEQKSTNAEQILASTQTKRVVMHFVTDRATRSKMESAFEEGYAKNAPGQEALLRKRMDQLKSYFGDMKKGEVAVITFVPGEGTHVSLNGAPKETIPGDDFARATLSLWLGPHPPGEDLKKGMLGLD